MSWVRLDDKFHSNPKMETAGNAARGLYASALSYCGDHLTDGFVPLGWVRKAGTLGERKKLTAVGAWKPAKEGETVWVNVRETQKKATVEYMRPLVAPSDGFVIFDYLTLNPSRTRIEEKRVDTAKRISEWRTSKGNPPESNAVTHTFVTGSERVSTEVPKPHAPKDQKQDLARTRARQVNPTDAYEREHPHVCPNTGCGVRLKSERRLLEHLENAHNLEGAAAMTVLQRAGYAPKVTTRD